MEHTISLIWLATWPILIFIIFRVAYAALKSKNFLTGEGEEE